MSTAQFDLAVNDEGQPCLSIKHDKSRGRVMPLSIVECLIKVAQFDALKSAAEAQCVGCKDGPPDKSDPKNHLPPCHGSLACNSYKVQELLEQLRQGET